MKKITILLLHMQHGGIEKQTITFANELIKRYNVEIISVYSMKKSPAYKVNEKVKITYLIDDAPNRNELKTAIKSKNIIRIIKEGIKSIKILYLKKHLMIKKVKNIDTDIVFSTRIEFAKLLSKYCSNNIIKITQEHVNNESEKYIKKVKKSFKDIDYLALLGPGSTKNYSKWLEDNKKIKLIEIPNILENIPEKSSKLEGNNLIAVGRLHPEKDFSTLIDVFNLVHKEIQNSTLTIVGGGDEYNKLQEKITKSNLKDSVEITGMVDANVVQEKMLKSDIYVMTSVSECFPMVLLEASSCGLPIIAFDVPVGPRAIIENDENGYLIQNRDINEISNKIIELLKNRDKLKELGIKSKEMSKKYLSTNIMNKWYEFFDKL